MAHDPAWPDKAMFAAYLLIIGGTLGLGVELVRLLGGTVVTRLPPDLAGYPWWLSTAGAAATLVMGVFCLRTQAAVFGYVGLVSGLLSLTYGGLVPLLSLLTLVMLIKSHQEGEETRNDGIRLHPGLWPDKAMAASLFMVVGGFVSIFQGLWIAFGKYEPVVLQVNLAAVLIDLVAGAFCIYAGQQVYHLKRPWLGELAAAACILTLGLYVVGPTIGIVILLLMLMARREDEFNTPGVHVTMVEAVPAKAGRSKATRKRKGEAS